MGKNIHGGDIYRHKNVIDYSSNCNPLGPPKGVVEAICSGASDIVHYPDVQASQLRDALSKHLSVKPEQIFFGNGAAEVIISIAFALKPKKALLLAPSFAEYGEALAAADCQIKYHYLEEKNGFAAGEDLMDAITADLDIFFLCNPNNPTGVLTDRNMVERLAEKCRRNGVTMVIDECFLDFVEASEKQSMIGRLAEYPNLIILKAFTKLYAMAGVRLGYCLCASAETMEKLDSVRQPWNVSSLAQAAGVAALGEENYVKTSLQTLAIEKAWLLEKMVELELTIYGSKANYIFFKGSRDFYEHCLEKGIMIRDCSNYEGLEKGYYRIAVRLHEDNEKLIQTLSLVLDKNIK